MSSDEVQSWLEKNLEKLEKSKMIPYGKQNISKEDLDQIKKF